MYPALLSSERFSATSACEILVHEMNDCITIMEMVKAHALEKRGGGDDGFAMRVSFVFSSQSGALKPPDSNIVESKADLP